MSEEARANTGLFGGGNWIVATVCSERHTHKRYLRSRGGSLARARSLPFSYSLISFAEGEGHQKEEDLAAHRRPPLGTSPVVS